MPNIRRCCIVGCNTNSRDYPNLQFFQFPKPESPTYVQWRRACHASLSHILPFKKPVVCARHFYSKNIGGRRLVGSAVPALYLDVNSNSVRSNEHQALKQEIEHSRKYAFINAVVYEWLVRANLNHSLRGSITHGMIKDKAIQAKQLINLDSFVADNRWLNKFRETHLKGFAAKLAANQLRPINNSLWIPDIVKDLQKMFPATNTDGTDKVPDKYFQYLQQYDDYMDNTQEQQQQQQQQQQYEQPQQQEQLHEQQEQYYNNNNNNNSPLLVPQIVDTRSLKSEKLDNETITNSPKLKGNYDIKMEFGDPSDLLHSILDTNDCTKNGIDDDVELIDFPTAVEDLTVDDEDEEDDDDDDDDVDADDDDQVMENDDNDKQSAASLSAGHNSPVETPQVVSTSKTATIKRNDNETLASYEAALEYLKPLEDFVLFKENFRGIGLLSQLEVILRRGVAANSGNTAK